MGITSRAGTRSGGYPDHHRLPAPRPRPQVYLAPSGRDDLHAIRDVDAHQHLSPGMGRRAPQATQLQRRRGGPAQPHIEGYWRIMIANVYYYRREANNDNTLEKYAADLPYDRLQRVAMKLDDGASFEDESVLGRPQGEDHSRCWARDV